MSIGREEKVSPIKLATAQYVVLGIMLLLIYGLWRLQVMGSKHYEELAETNRIKTVPILAPRGKILDREGRIIVDNYPSFSALLIREQAHDLERKIPLIASGLDLDPNDIRDRLRKMARRPESEPLMLKQDITPDELAFIEANKNEVPELETIMVHRRLYPKDGFLAHLIGYVGEVSEEDLNRPEFELYSQGDIVGKSGVEQQYNDMLKGEDGALRVIVDSKGREVGRLSQQPAKPGKPLKLTIDLDLQIAAEQALEGKNGAIVAMDPRNGEILAMVSRPTFDPNDFAVRISSAEWNKLITDPAKPLLNKAIQAQLAPGSVFKIIMSVAGLQEGIAQTMHVNCPGGGTFYGRYFKCWISHDHKTHGMVDITKAIYQSCDTFFYTLGERLGIGKIAEYAQALGIGKRTGIDLPDEVSGVMPSEEWKIRNFKQKWYPGETISVSIGQGAVATTPIQLARAIGAITSGGRLVRPHVAFPDDNFRSDYQQVADTFSQTRDVHIDPQNWEIITDAMARVLAPEGTAPVSHVPGIDIAGKTGSAQVVSNAARAKLKGSQFADNGWFVGVAPRRNPEIVVAALFEQGEHGALTARIVTQVIKAFVDKKRREAAQTAMVKSDGKVDVAVLYNSHDSGPDGGGSASGTDDHLHGTLMQVDVRHGTNGEMKSSRAALAELLPMAPSTVISSPPNIAGGMLNVSGRPAVAAGGAR